MKKNILLFALLSIITTACMPTTEKESMTKNLEGLVAPVATKKDSILSMHGDTRTDPYFWMRLTDDQKNAETPDDQTQGVLDYLNAENDFTENVMKHTSDFQKEIFEEIV
ncbi:MAG: hypothetical protein P8M34_09170, partial [Saprospiraceae bacterium]|nr:hypothetical protein [Saprospiraceae bacterium]